ncbi:hypothetical protein H8E06_01240 [bacterium]|nr:hypothetical protein [bacterium]
MSTQKQNLQLTCIITGKSRFTNTAYLEKKARLSGNAEQFIESYVSRTAAKLLRQGHTVQEVREQLNVPDQVPAVSDERAKEALAINGSRSRAKQPEPAIA